MLSRGQVIEPEVFLTCCLFTVAVHNTLYPIKFHVAQVALSAGFYELLAFIHAIFRELKNVLGYMNPDTDTLRFEDAVGVRPTINWS